MRAYFLSNKIITNIKKCLSTNQSNKRICETGTKIARELECKIEFAAKFYMVYKYKYK